jgi:hypothetical protein
MLTYEYRICYNHLGGDDMKTNLVGKRFGRLIVNDFYGKDNHRNLLWYCLCDCGKVTIQRTNTLNMGLVQSCGCYKLERIKDKESEKNPMWKGTDVGKIALHSWLRRRMPKPCVCEICGDRKPQDIANISRTYTRNVLDYRWMCRKCHMIFDERMDNRKPNGQFSIMHAH